MNAASRVGATAIQVRLIAHPEETREGNVRRTRRAVKGVSDRRPPAAASASEKAREAPPLAELRRRATQRLQEIACLLAVVRAEYLVALADCQRLQAARPLADPELPAEGEAVEQLAARFGALRGKLKQMESALTAAHDRNRELQARIAHLERGHGQEGAPASPGAVGIERAAGEGAGRTASAHPDASVQDEMTGLLGFLDELTEMLPDPAGTQTR